MSLCGKPDAQTCLEASQEEHGGFCRATISELPAETRGAIDAMFATRRR